MAGTKLVVQTMPFLIKEKITFEDVPKRRTMSGDFGNYFCIVGYILLVLNYFSAQFIVNRKNQNLVKDPGE